MQSHPISSHPSHPIPSHPSDPTHIPLTSHSHPIHLPHTRVLKQPSSTSHSHTPHAWILTIKDWDNEHTIVISMRFWVGMSMSIIVHYHFIVLISSFNVEAVGGQSLPSGPPVKGRSTRKGSNAVKKIWGDSQSWNYPKKRQNSNKFTKTRLFDPKYKRLRISRRF